MFSTFPGNPTGLAARSEAVALHYEFAFDPHETVVYTGPGPFPGRVFVLHFWRKAKDGIMHLLGYQQQGHWRDPSTCFPDSYVRYYRPAHARPRADTPTGPDQPPTAKPEAPQDSAQHQGARQPIAHLTYRVPLLQLEHDVWELPTLKRQPMHVIASARRFPQLPSALKRRVPTGQPALKVPIQKTLYFVDFSNHFENITQADRELSGIVKVLKQFPQLQVTIQGNAQGSLKPGFGAAARASQNMRFTSPFTTKWPNEVEKYHSIGELMDSRARAVKHYLVSKGISAQRIHAMRGQFTKDRIVTIIFSN